MEKIIELFQQIQELAGAGADALKEALGGAKPGGEGKPPEGGAPDGGGKPPEGARRPPQGPPPEEEEPK